MAGMLLEGASLDTAFRGLARGERGTVGVACTAGTAARRGAQQRCTRTPRNSLSAGMYPEGRSGLERSPGGAKRGGCRSKWRAEVRWMERVGMRERGGERGRGGGKEGDKQNDRHRERERAGEEAGERDGGRGRKGHTA